ncbi:MAG: serine hydrolase domain-containing protein [Pseudomonadota bacterium]
MTRISIVLKAAFLLISQFVLVWQAHSEHFSDDRIAAIDALIEARLSELRIPGAALVLVEDGRIVHARGYGYANLEDRTPVTSKTIFAIGSVSKSLVANVILQMQDERVLSLDDPVVQHIPGFRSRNKTNSDAITIRDLMQHTSGFSTFDGNRNQTDNSRADDALARVASKTRHYRLNRAVGVAFEYSNANYETLGYLIETLEGRLLERSIEQRVFEEIGMSASGILRDDVADLATPYRFTFSTPRPFAFKPGRAIGPKGGVYTNAEDMGAYLNAVLSAQSPIASWAPDWAAAGADAGDFHYGPGWMVLESDRGPLIKHNGMNGGYSALAGFSPDIDAGFAIMLNASRGSVAGDVEYLTEGAWALAFDQASPTPTIGQAQWTQLIILSSILVGVGIWGIVFSVRLRKRSVRAPGNLLSAVVQIWLPSIALLSIAYLALSILPALFGLPLEALRLFVPDVGYLLSVVGFVSLGLALLRLIAMVVLPRLTSEDPTKTDATPL